MTPAGRIIEHTNARIDHLIVSNEQKTRVKNCLLQTLDRSVRLASHLTEVLLRQVDQHLVLDVTSAHDDHILAVIVSRVVINHHVSVDLPNVVNISQDGLAHHMVPENVIVNVLHQCFLTVLVHALKLLPNGVLFHLEVVVIIDRVAEHVTEDLD